MLFRHLALPWLTRGERSSERLPEVFRLKKENAGRHINKEGRSPARRRHPRCRRPTSCPLAFRTRRDTRTRSPNGTNQWRSAEVWAPSGASADPRLPGGALPLLPPAGSPRCASPRRRPLAGAGRRPHAGAPRPLLAVAVAARCRTELRLGHRLVRRGR